MLGYPDMAAAADAVPALLPHHPVALEGLDSRIVDVVRRRRGAAGGARPAARRRLAVRRAGRRHPGRGRGRRAGALARASGALDDERGHRRDRGRAVADPRGRRRAGRALARPARRPSRAGRTPPCRPTGWAPTCATSTRCWPSTGCRRLPYGHFGDGCIHARIDFPLERAPKRIARVRRRRPQLVAAHGGSMSGEHGDGRARGELLPLMYSPRRARAAGPRQGPVRPRRPAQPGRHRRPAPAGRRPAASRLAAPLRRAPGLRLPARRRRLHHRGAPLHRGRQVPRRHHRGRRRDVPVVPGHPRREGLHPGPGPGAAGDGQRRRW